MIATIDCTRTREATSCPLHDEKGTPDEALARCIKCEHSVIKFTQTGNDRMQNGVKKIFDGMTLEKW